MTTTNMQPDAAAVSGSDDQPVAETTSPGAADEAKAVLAKARYEAFRLVTDARNEAEEILDQARAEAEAIRNEAEMQAESIVDAAHLRAGEVTPPEPSGESAESVAQLEQEHEELTQRVSSLRTLADQLEERFAALAAHATAPRPELEEPPRPVLDYSPSVAAPPPAEATDELDDSTDDDVVPERGSFYSRRSAKLPRIGEAGGQSALDMMRTMRESIDNG
jgi:F0F1-type ATP synthase membrane subunit b/b'